MISKDSMLLIYATEHIRVKVYLRRATGNGFRRRAGMPVRCVLECAVQSAARSGRFSVEARAKGRQFQQDVSAKAHTYCYHLSVWRYRQWNCQDLCLSLSRSLP